MGAQSRTAAALSAQAEGRISRVGLVVEPSDAFLDDLLAAVEDVENAMIGYLESRLERASMMEVLRAYEEVLMLGVERYATGIDDLETLLDTEQQLFSALQSLAVVDGQVSSNAVLLYKALGGGWRLVPEGTTGAEVLREQDEFTNEETSS